MGEEISLGMRLALNHKGDTQRLQAACVDTANLFDFYP